MKLHPKDQHADAICDWIAEGNSLASYCREKKLRYGSVMEWLSQDQEFAEKYTRAREESAEADADKVCDVANRVISGELEPNAARVAIDAFKWSAGQRKPKKYGSKIDLNHGVTEELGEIMQRIRSRNG